MLIGVILGLFFLRRRYYAESVLTCPAIQPQPSIPHKEPSLSKPFQRLDVYNNLMQRNARRTLRVPYRLLLLLLLTILPLLAGCDVDPAPTPTPTPKPPP